VEVCQRFIQLCFFIGSLVEGERMVSKVLSVARFTRY
jgi:hypothetical protein